MLNLYFRLMNWLHNEEGQGMAEYGLIIALVAIVVIVALTALGTNLTKIFESIGTAVGGS